MEKNDINNMSEIYSIVKENINSQFSAHSTLKMLIVYDSFFSKILKDIDIETLTFERVELDLNYSDLLEKYKKILQSLRISLKHNIFNKTVLKEIIVLFLVVYNCYLEDNKKHNEISDVQNTEDLFEDNTKIVDLKEFVRKRLNLK